MSLSRLYVGPLWFTNVEGLSQKYRKPVFCGDLFFAVSRLKIFRGIQLTRLVLFSLYIDTIWQFCVEPIFADLFLTREILEKKGFTVKALSRF